jgi:hypothetical protein
MDRFFYEYIPENRILMISQAVKNILRIELKSNIDCSFSFSIGEKEIDL